MSAAVRPEVDVAILGGGVAGLTLALEVAAQRPQTRITVFERATYPVPETVHKVGESTVEIAAHYLRDVLHLGSHLQSQQLNKFGLRVFFSNGDNTDITTRTELGHAVRPPQGVGTYQLDRGRLENALAAKVRAEGIDLRPGSKVLDVDLRPAGDHRITVLTAEGTQEDVTARWVVDATGRASMLKRRLGLSKPVGHRANAVWFHIDHPIDIGEWSDDPEWRARITESRRELSTNHLMGPGYWVWLIRLASGSISVGIVTDPTLHPFAELNRFDRALDWLRRHEPQCADQITRYQDKLLDFRVMSDYAYGAEQVFSGDRWCLAGEAGVFLDPLYSPGLDLIAMSNGLITDLLRRALDGEDVTERAAVHNEMFLLIANGWLEIYQDQYPLMGHPRVMIAKVIWDTAVYWAVPGLLYFHDALKDLIDLPAVVASLARFSVASKQVQEFFRRWGQLDIGPGDKKFVSFYDFDFMARLQRGMTAGLDRASLQVQFEANVQFVEQLSGQLVATVIGELESDPDDPRKAAQVARWRADPILMSLVDVFETDREHHHPVDDGWITLAGAHPAACGGAR